jgi:hypothetical protein
MHEYLTTRRERRRVWERYCKIALQDLGWTVYRNDEVYAPGETHEHHTELWTLQHAAAELGFPADLDDMYAFGRALRDVYVRGSPDRTVQETEDLYAAARAARRDLCPPVPRREPKRGCTG